MYDVSSEKEQRLVGSSIVQIGQNILAQAVYGIGQEDSETKQWFEVLIGKRWGKINELHNELESTPDGSSLTPASSFHP
ncbi:hypothetical protein VNO77_43518 [Canavalia gladiata]|uniref:Uncharacterized protein n=1 Tax=Canavalia gladiata TaxID=3824 RepID=A0AAN9PPZ9_CANGL